VKELEMTKSEILVGIYDLPPNTLNETESSYKPSALKTINNIVNFFKANKTIGALFVQGSASLLTSKFMEFKLTKGIDFKSRLDDPFQQRGSFVNPKCDVIIVYNCDIILGSLEVARNLMKEILRFYKSNTLVIIESQKSHTEFRTLYDISFTNKVQIPLVDEPKFDFK
jgi:hypothetical protein